MLYEYFAIPSLPPTPTPPPPLVSSLRATDSSYPCWELMLIKMILLQGCKWHWFYTLGAQWLSGLEKVNLIPIKKKKKKNPQKAKYYAF